MATAVMVVSVASAKRSLTSTAAPSLEQEPATRRDAMTAKGVVTNTSTAASETVEKRAMARSCNATARCNNDMSPRPPRSMVRVSVAIIRPRRG